MTRIGKAFRRTWPFRGPSLFGESTVVRQTGGPPKPIRVIRVIRGSSVELLRLCLLRGRFCYRPKPVVHLRPVRRARIAPRIASRGLDHALTATVQPAVQDAGAPTTALSDETTDNLWTHRHA
jgi:hypothetical protein